MKFQYLLSNFNCRTETRLLRLRANGRNIVGQQLLTLLDVTCCVCCTPSCMLLRVVGQSLKPVILLAPCKRTQHCWELLRQFARRSRSYTVGPPMTATSLQRLLFCLTVLDLVETSLQRPPLFNDCFILSLRWLLWRGLTVTTKQGKAPLRTKMKL